MQLSEEQKKQLEAMDARLSYEDLITFRALAHALKKLEKQGKLAWQEKLSRERAKDTAVGAFFSKIFDDKKVRQTCTQTDLCIYQLCVEQCRVPCTSGLADSVCRNSLRRRACVCFCSTKRRTMIYYGKIVT